MHGNVQMTLTRSGAFVAAGRLCELCAQCRAVRFGWRMGPHRHETPNTHAFHNGSEVNLIHVELIPQVRCTHWPAETKGTKTIPHPKDTLMICLQASQHLAAA
jgi:hypothetical protein